ncbi:MAG TPA: argininosuccinate lyase [Desulfatiglandales bacterium]|nr:argininosuccinate lyase [Desulfatiglandales bacterium]
MRKQKQSEYRGFRRPGIRLTEELLPNIVTHSSEHELPELYAHHMFDKAHLVMLAEENIIPRRDAALMLASLREMEAEGIEKVRLEVGGGIHSGEQYLIRKLSEEIGGRIHLGRSSGDLDKVADRIKQRDKLLEVMDAVNGFRHVLLKVAADHVDTVMPGYTHAQHAQPTTLGHQLLAWAVTLSRDFKRLEAVLHRINVSPAGAAIMTGSNFPLNRHRVAELLGFERPCENTLDAIHSPDDMLEVFSVIAISHSNLARWADDIIIWTSSEVGMVDIPDRFCGTSSILAQKKNAYAMEHARGAAASTVGGLMTAFFGEKGPTGLSIYSWNRYAKPALLSSFDNVVRDLNWLTELLSALKVNKTLMRQRAGAFWAQATDVAGAIVRDKGVSWRTAHQIVGILVRLSYERGIAPRHVQTTLLDEAAVEYMDEPIGLSEESLRKALDPGEFVKGRTLYGGPAPQESRRRIAEFAEVLKRDEDAVVDIRGRLEAASENLEKAIDRIIDTYAKAPSSE